MRLLIDTNVILDDVLKRPDHLAASHLVISFYGTDHDAWIAWHSLSNLFYILRKFLQSSEGAQNLIKDLLDWIHVSPVEHSDALRAFTLGLTDFEDALQIVAAESCQADFIVTRDSSHYAKSTVPAVTPTQFLRRFHPGLLP